MRESIINCYDDRIIYYIRYIYITRGDYYYLKQITLKILLSSPSISTLIILVETWFFLVLLIHETTFYKSVSLSLV